jgi:hypothetical protein
LLFLIWFVADIINGQQEDYSLITARTISFRVLSILFMLNHSLHELKQMIKEGPIDYMINDFWNFVDMALMCTYFSYFVVSFLYPPTDYNIIGLQTAVIILFGIKINFYLRLFDGFGFLVQMIVITFRDIRQFLLYFFILISFMAIQLTLIFPDHIEGYEGISGLSWFILAMQLNISSFEDQTTHTIIFWIIWFI